MLAQNRKSVLLLALAGVAALTLFAPAPDTGVAASSPVRLTQAAGVDAVPRVRGANREAGRPSLPAEFPARGALAGSNGAHWDAQSWLPPIPAIPAVAATRAPMPPPPAPPAMPYRYAGQLLREGLLQIFVAKDDTPVAVKQGDSLDGYVVESITADVINLVYPPLGNKAIIAISLAQTL